jgi:hypothetical protein
VSLPDRGCAAERPAVPEAPPAPSDPAAAADQCSGPRCTCGHGKRAHQHYRRGSDCALCACRRFRSTRRHWWRFVER